MLNAEQKKQLKEEWEARVAQVQNTNWGQSPLDSAERIKRAKNDYSFFVKEYFPEVAKKECAQFQIDAANYLKANPKTRALFEWGRGHAKSSHISLMIPLWLKIQDERSFNVMVLVSKSEYMAVRLLSDLQAELEYNEAYMRDFGAQTLAGSWADGEFTTKDGCFFKALGRGQSPRGIKKRSKRPDYIVMDDLDDDEIVLNPKRVKKAFEWCRTALFGTMEGGRGRFVMVGNRIGKDSILTRFAESKKIFHTTVNMLDQHGKPSWPENYTLEEIQEIREFVTERPFQKEYMNNPINEGTVFLQKYFRYGKMLDLKLYKSLTCYTDPSFKDSATADYKATMLMGKTDTGEYHLLKAYAGQESIAEMVRWHYAIDTWIDRRVPVLYYMESNFLQDLILDEFTAVGNAMGHHVPVRGDKRKKPDKYARIEALSPLFERRLVVFNQDEKDSEGMSVLVEQLLMFEKGTRTHDDAPDALEGAIYMLAGRTRASNTSYAYGARPSRRY